MWGFSKSKAEVISHWYVLVPEFNTSAKDFYEQVERALKHQEVPGLESFHVEFAEGGILSAQREYLRLTRERLVFDVCAAQFGKSFFFSCRFAEIPIVVQLWQLLVVILAFLFVVPYSLSLCFRIFGMSAPVVWFLGWSGLLVLGIYVLRNAIALGLKDLDAALIKSPVVGPIYERWFRKITYYREDTRLMYCDVVDGVVKALVEETTGKHGIKLIRFNEHSPILGELYKPTVISLPRTAPSA
jgi:hypothetical protein